MLELAAAPLIPEVLHRLPIGTIVRLPDDTLAEVEWSSIAEVHVVHGYLRAAGIPGAGPWIFARLQVEPATADEVVSYFAAVAHAAVRGGVVWAVQR